MKTLRTPDENFNSLPGWNYAPHYIDDLAGYEGLRLHYVDEGSRDGVTFLCLHGQPTWSYLYRKMAKVFLEAGHRFLAPDLFGFGRSDKPIDDDVYTFDFHRGALLAFIKRMELTNVCLVVQDWGGILGLTLPMESPEIYKRLIVMNTGMPAGEEPGEGFAGWRVYNRSQQDFLAGRLLKRGKPDMTAGEAAAYDAPFPDQNYKAGVRRFPELVMLKEDGRLSQIASDGVPTMLRARKFWSEDWSGESYMAVGTQDPVFGVSQMEVLRGQIRNCPEPLQIDGGHFIQEWGTPIAEAALKSFNLD